MNITCKALGTYTCDRLIKPRIFTVRARFAHVLNLTDGCDVLSVQDEDIPRTPLSLVLKNTDFAAFCRLVRDRAGLVAGGGMLKDGTLALSTTSAQRFSCRPDARGAHAPRMESFRRLCAGVALFAKSDSLAFVGKSTLAVWADGERTDTQRMVRVLLDEGRPWELVGLGGGLTPSGDDFLVGYLAVDCAWGEDTSNRALAERLVPLLGRTTELSGAFLRAALAGEFSLPILDLLQALNRNTDDLLPILAKLCAVGHTSGSDLLGGILYGLNQYFIREGTS